jgi:hypothetical protein
MPWWALIPIVSMITGPAALYVVTRRRRDADEQDERFDELSRKYDELLAEVRSRELPEGPGEASRNR